MNNILTEGVDYYILADGRLVFTAQYLLRRGFCCGNGCMNCPYDYINVPGTSRNELLELRELNEKETSAKENIFDIIYDVVRCVPKGRVTTYGAVAAAIGVKSGARMVGYAMNASFSAKPKVPAHRVLNRNGMLTGKHHFATPKLMQQLLEKEGIKVKKDIVIGFDKLFWDPVKELEI